ncbi:MAG TPA: hypothetical protein VE397_12135 [Stellaceae bacterium]|nr:hypothetical protein [Stellaceae bacterium]
MLHRILERANRLDGLLRLRLGRLYFVILAAGCVIELIHRLRERHQFIHTAGSMVGVGFAVVLYVVLVLNQASALYGYLERRRSHSARDDASTG